MNITRNYQGAYVISAMVKGYRVQRTYLGYKRREAIAMFKDDTR